MADRNTKITMTSGKSHNLSSTVEQVENAIAGVTLPHVPLIKAVDDQGQDIWINATKIETIQAYSYKTASTQVTTAT
jgi:uncharacterized protein YlzI (FlbEa/FlbD family)